MNAVSCRFSPFALDEGQRLLRSGRPVRLRPKPLALLRLLLQRPGGVFELGEIKDALWPGGAVPDDVVNVCVAELGRALEDDRPRPRYLEAIHRRGFRFMAPVEDAGRMVAEDGPLAGSRWLEGAWAGRERELRELAALWERARSGDAQVAVVTGGAGMGKSALVSRFLGSLHGLDTWASPGAFMIARGQCAEMQAPREPFRPALEALGALCAGPFGAEILARVGEAVPALLLQLPAALDPAEARALRNRFGHRGPETMLQDLARAVAAVSRIAPLVLVVEDLHWADESSIDLVAALASRRDPARLLVIVTTRPADAILSGYPGRLLRLRSGAGARVTEIALGLLGEDGVRSYLDQAFHSSALTTTLAPWLAERTHGDPLFLGAMVEHLLGSGVLCRDAGGWRLARTEFLAEVPENLERLLRGRTASLAANERRALEAGAVCGDVFAAPVIAAALDCSVEEASSACKRLEVQHLLLEDCGPLTWPDGTVGQSYRFRHGLYREIVESGLPPARLRVLHARVGARLEQAFTGSHDEVAVELAAHFRAAADAERTLKFSTLASRRAVSRGGYREAIAHLRTAREALARLPAGEARDRDELRLLAKLAPLLVATQGLVSGEAGSVLVRLRELSSRIEGLALRVATLATLTTVWRQRGAVEVAAATSRELLAIAGEAEEPSLRLTAHMIAGTTRFHASEFGPAVRHFKRCLQIGAATDLEATDAMAALSLCATRGHLAMLRWFGGRIGAARDLAESLLLRARATGFAPVGSMGHVLAAWTFVMLRDFPRVEAIVGADAIVASDPPLPLWMATSTVMRGWAWVHTGRVEDGLAEVESGYRAYLDTLGEASAFDYQMLRCDAYVRAGRLHDASAMLDEALENLRTYKQGYFAPELHRIRGEALAARGGRAALGEARSAWRQGLAMARARGARSCELRLALALASSSPDGDDGRVDRERVRGILTSFGPGDDSPDVLGARRLLGESLA